MITRRRISYRDTNRTSFEFFKNYETNNFVFYLTSDNYHGYLASRTDYLVIQIPIFMIQDVYTGDYISSNFLTNVDLYTSAVNASEDPENPIKFGSITPEFLGYEYDYGEDHYYANIGLYFNNFNKYGKDTIYYNNSDGTLNAGNMITIYSCYNDGRSIYDYDDNSYLNNPMYFQIGSGTFELERYKNINIIEDYPIKHEKDVNGVYHPTPSISIFNNIIHDIEYIHYVDLSSYWDSFGGEFVIPSISFIVCHDTEIIDGSVTAVVKYISSIDIYFDEDVMFSHNTILNSPVKIGCNGNYLFDVTIPDFDCRVIPTSGYSSATMYISVHYSVVQTTVHEE